MLNVVIRLVPDLGAGRKPAAGAAWLCLPFPSLGGKPPRPSGTPPEEGNLGVVGNLPHSPPLEGCPKGGVVEGIIWDRLFWSGIDQQGILPCRQGSIQAKPCSSPKPPGQNQAVQKCKEAKYSSNPIALIGSQGHTGHAKFFTCIGKAFCDGLLFVPAPCLFV